MVGVLGLEPRSLAALDFESSVFTNFTILPINKCKNQNWSITPVMCFWQLSHVDLYILTSRSLQMITSQIHKLNN